MLLDSDLFASLERPLGRRRNSAKTEIDFGILDKKTFAKKTFPTQHHHRGGEGGVLALTGDPLDKIRSDNDKKRPRRRYTVAGEALRELP
jgi:hypothetical protein